jgi:hypothetical protein
LAGQNEFNTWYFVMRQNSLTQIAKGKERGTLQLQASTTAEDGIFTHARTFPRPVTSADLLSKGRDDYVSIPHRGTDEEEEEDLIHLQPARRDTCTQTNNATRVIISLSHRQDRGKENDSRATFEKEFHWKLMSHNVFPHL